jgi:hypothetical protein
MIGPYVITFEFCAGDLLATLDPAHDAIEAIISTRSSSAAYRALLKELYVLGQPCYA